MERIGVRSRIHGLGLDDRLDSRVNSHGMVESQEGCWYDSQIAGQVMLSAGPRRRERPSLPNRKHSSKHI
ncbi:hypothetical protein EV421DRAFT_1864869 [Armillaria borealis]|uniref:Uncharacterized protein n=1 Tax=Armillaria borealis TaxID=47425 RepID=A0AA39IVE6_9AGAR|nr:hypothetical protein EV421DRAFT_1864869 [Armillaria borealis]